MVFKTRQDCEGSDWRVAVKENGAANNKSPYPGPRGSPFKKRPFGPVLKGRQQNPPAPGAPRGWVTASLVPAAACHFENTKTEWVTVRAFLSARFSAAALIEGNYL